MTTVILITSTVLYLAFAIAAISSVVNSNTLTRQNKALWVVVIALAPILGAIAWCVAGRGMSRSITR